MSWLSNIIRGKKTGGNVNQFNNPELVGSSGSADALTGEGLTKLRDLSGEYRTFLDNGGLTPELSKQFDVAKGTLSDNYARAGRSLSASLAARRAQSGGALTPQAIGELQKEGDEQSAEQYFGASNDLAMAKADLSYKATSDWYGRIQGIADTIRSTGMTQKQQALLARLQLAGLGVQSKGQDLSFLSNFFKTATDAFL